MELRIIKQSLDKLSEASERLNSSDDAKLDCTGVYNLEEEELKALFSHIRPEWKRWPELEQFINLDTIHEDLRLVIYGYLKNVPLENPPTKSENSPLLSSPSIVRAIVTILLLIGGLSSLVFVGRSLPYFLKPKLQADSLKIGTLYKVESQAKLADYLREKLVPSNYFDFLKGKKIEIVVDGDQTLSYQEAQNRMETKEWDIAFTMSPINSIFAKNNGYSFLGNMFPEDKSYESGLFVRKDIPLLSLSEKRIRIRKAEL
jgi:hypothetical protein